MNISRKVVVSPTSRSQTDQFDLDADPMNSDTSQEQSQSLDWSRNWYGPRLREAKYAISDTSSEGSARMSLTVVGVLCSSAPQWKYPFLAWDAHSLRILCVGQKACTSNVDIIECIHEQWIFRVRVSISCQIAPFGKLTRVTDHSFLFSDCAYSVRRVRLFSIVPRSRMSGRNFGISPIQGSRFLEVFNELLTSLGTQTVLVHCVDVHRNSHSMDFSNTCDGQVSVDTPEGIGWP